MNQDETQFDRCIRDGWRSLHHDRAGRARLARCRRPADAYLLPAFHRWIRTLDACGETFARDRMAVAAILLADSRADDLARSVAELMGRGKTPVVSEPRFRRLLACDEQEALLANMRRIVRQLQGTVNLTDLVRSIRYWGDNTKFRWAADYYASGAQR